MVDCSDREAMEMNIQPASRRNQQISAVAITEGEVELTIADHDLPIGFPTANPPAVPGADVVVVFVDVVDLIKAQKAHLAFYTQMSAQIKIEKAADTQKAVRPIIGLELRKKSSHHHMGAAPAQAATTWA